MSITTVPDGSDKSSPPPGTEPHRTEVIAGLRELAQFLADKAAIERVRQMAALLGVEINHRDAYWTAQRRFSGVKYGCTYVERAQMAQYDAAHSYEGAVEPVTEAGVA